MGGEKLYSSLDFHPCSVDYLIEEDELRVGGQGDHCLSDLENQGSSIGPSKAGG